MTEMLRRIRHIGWITLLLALGRLTAQENIPVLDTVCPDAARFYRVDGEEGSVYSWKLTLPDATTQIQPSNADTIAMVWSFAPGTYLLECIQHGIHCDDTAVLGQVIIINTPIVYAGSDRSVCSNNSITIDDAEAQYANSLLWTTSGDGTFDDPTRIDPTYTPGSADIVSGSVILTLTGKALASEGGCSDATDSMILSISLAVNVFAGEDTSICEGENYILADATAENALSVTWTTSGDGMFEDNGILNTTYYPGTADIIAGYVTLTLTATGEEPCPVDEDAMILTITGAPVANAGPDGGMCTSEGSYTLTGLAENAASILWSTNGDGTFSDPGLLTAVYTPGTLDIANGTAVLTLTVNGNGNCDPVEDEMTLTISLAPVVFAGEDAAICEGESYFLSDASVLNSDDVSWTTSGDGTFDDAGEVNTEYTPGSADIEAGSVLLILTASDEQGICPDESDTLILTVTGAPIVNAGPDGGMCTSEGSYTLAGTAENYASVLWTTAGDGTFDNETLLTAAYTPGTNDIASGQVTLTLTAFGNGTCGDVSDNMILTIWLDATAFAGEDAGICEGETYTLSDAAADNYSEITWSSSGTGTFNDIHTIHPTYSPDDGDINSGSVVLTLTATGNGTCPPAVDAMTLTVTGAPIVNAGPDGGMCTSEGSYTLAGTAENYASVQWTTAGDGTFDNETLLTAAYTPGTDDIASGQVTLTLTAFGNGTCGDVTDNMILTIWLDATAFAGEDAGICEGETYTLSDASADNYSEITWSSSGTGAFNDIHAIHPTYTPSDGDINSGSVVLTLTATGNGTCPPAVDAMTLTVTGAPIVNAGPDGGMCTSEGSYTLAGTAENYASVLWTTAGDGTFNNETLLTAAYTPGTNDIASGQVTLTLTAFGNGTCGDVSDNMTLTIWLDATAFAGEDAGICEGETYTLADASADNYSEITWSSSGTGTFNDIHTIHPTYTPDDGDINSGSVVLTLTATGNGTCPPAVDAMTLTVTGAPIVNAGPDGGMCTSEGSYTLAGTAENYASVLWTTAGDGTFDNETLLTAAYTPGTDDIATGQVILTLTAFGNGTCGDVSDNMTLTIWLDATAFAGEDAGICEGETYTLSDAAADNYSEITWSSSGTGTFNDIHAIHPTYTPDDGDINNGSVVLTLTATGNGTCPPAVDAMTLTVTGAPIVNAGPDGGMCTSEGSYTQAGTAENYASVQWTTAGDGTFDNETLLTAAYTPGTNDIASGQVTLTLTAFGNGTCGDVSDNMILTIWLDATAFAGEDAGICEGETYTLAGASADNYSEITWSSSGTGTFNDIHAIHPTYTPSDGDISSGSVVLTLTATGNGTCPPAVDAMTLTVTGAPIVNAGPDGGMCTSEGSYTLAGTAENYASVLWTTAGDGTFNNETLLTAAYTPGTDDIASGQVTLTLTAFGNGTCGDVSDNMTLTIWLAVIAFAGEDDAICEGQSYTLSDATVENSDDFAWTTSGDGTFNDTGEVNPVYIPGTADIDAGWVTLTLTATGEGVCPEDSDEMILTITGAPIAIAGPDAGVCEGESYQLTGTFAENYSEINWSSSGTGAFNAPHALDPTYAPSAGDISSGTVTLTLTATGIGTCGNADDAMILTIWPSATAFAGGDDGICGDEAYALVNSDATNYTTINWSSSGTGSFDAPHALHPTYTPSADDISSGEVTLTLTAWGEGEGCPPATSSMLLSITEAPTVEAGYDEDVCSSVGFVTVTGTATNYSSILWSTSGNGTFASPSSLTTTYDLGNEDIANGQVYLILTATGFGDCGEFDDAKLVTIWLDASADAGPDDAVCGQEPCTISGATAGNYSAIHWATSGTGTFNNYGIVNPTYTPGPEDVQNESVVLEITAFGAGGCPNAVDEMTLTITGPPDVNAGDNASVCSNEFPFLTQATAVNYSSLLWSTGGDGIFDDPGSLTASYTPGVNDISLGFAVLTLLAEGNGTCPDVSDQMTLTIWLSASANAGPDAIICEGESYTLADATADFYVSLEWTSSGTGSFNDITILNPTYVPGPEDIASGTVTLTLIAHGLGNCAPDSSSMVLTITGAPVANAGPDGIICSIDSVYSLSGFAENYASILWTSTGSGVFADPTQLQTTYTISSDDIDLGMISLILTSVGNGSCGSVSDTLNLGIFKAPTAFAGSDASICEGDTYQLFDASATDYSFVSWTSSFGSGSFDNPNAINPTYTPGNQDITNGWVKLILTAQGSLYCPVASDTMLLIITLAPTTSAGDDASLCTSDTTIILSGAASNYSSVLWTTSGNGIFSDSSILTPTYTPDLTDINTGFVTLTLTLFGNGTCEPISDSLVLTILLAPWRMPATRQPSARAIRCCCPVPGQKTIRPCSGQPPAQAPLTTIRSLTRPIIRVPTIL